MAFLDLYKHLLPRAKAWRITVDKQLRQFFDGLSGFPQDIRDFFDGIHNELDPELTTSLDDWEEQFGLPDTGLTIAARRDRLAAAWAATGGQSPRYIQDTLQAAGFDVYVHEWWEPGSDPPVARNPLLYLNDNTGFVEYLANDGGVLAQDGNEAMQDGSTTDFIAYPLVNKILVPVITTQDGRSDMQDGDSFAQDGTGSGEYSLKKYVIALNPDNYPFFLYIGGQTFPDLATVPASRQNEFEDLCLKICPTQQWLGILVEYT